MFVCGAEYGRSMIVLKRHGARRCGPETAAVTARSSAGNCPRSEGPRRSADRSRGFDEMIATLRREDAVQGSPNGEYPLTRHEKKR